MQYKKGERIRHPKREDWGIGEVCADSVGGFVTVFFENAGEKKISLEHVHFYKVSGKDAISPVLDEIISEETGKYQIGKIPNIRVQHNERTWKIIEEKLATVASATYEQLVIWCKGHNHPAGGRGFVNYCIDNGWLVLSKTNSTLNSKESAPSAYSHSRQTAATEQNEEDHEGESCAFNNPIVHTNDGLLNAYIHNFFGYGSLSSPLWFVGMEEGVGKESLDDRLHAWETLGKSPTVDIREFHRLINESRWFTENAQIQKTWKGPILAALAYFGMPSGREEVRRYQTRKLATDDLALLELMPLPHKSLSSWNHGNIFPTKSVYRESVAPQRIAWFKKQIEERRPKAVVMYGTTPPYPDYWSSIAGEPFQTKDGWEYRKTEKTIFIMCRHPVAHGVTDSYFFSIGNFLKDSQL